jgi:hypothetical protein
VRALTCAEPGAVRWEDVPTPGADSRRFLPDVIDLVTSGLFGPAVAPTAVVPWDQAYRARLEPAIKLVIGRTAGSQRSSANIQHVRAGVAQ